MSRIQYQPASRRRGFKPRNLSTTAIAQMRAEASRITKNMEKTRNAEKEQRDRELQAMKEDNQYEEQIRKENFDIQIANLQSERNQLVTGIQLEDAEARADQAQLQANLQGLIGLSKLAGTVVQGLSDLDQQQKAQKITNDENLQPKIVNPVEAQQDYNEFKNALETGAEASVALSTMSVTEGIQEGRSKAEISTDVANEPFLAGQNDAYSVGNSYRQNYGRILTHLRTSTENKYTAPDGSEFTGPDSIANSTLLQVLQQETHDILRFRLGITNDLLIEKPLAEIRNRNLAMLQEADRKAIEFAQEISLDQARNTILNDSSPSNITAATHNVKMQVGRKRMHDFNMELVMDPNTPEEVVANLQNMPAAQLGYELGPNENPDITYREKAKPRWDAALAKRNDSIKQFEQNENEFEAFKYGRNVQNNLPEIKERLRKNPAEIERMLKEGFGRFKKPIPEYLRTMISDAYKDSDEATTIEIENRFKSKSLTPEYIKTIGNPDLQKLATEKYIKQEGDKYGPEWTMVKKGISGNARKLTNISEGGTSTIRTIRAEMHAHKLYAEYYKLFNRDSNAALNRLQKDFDDARNNPGGNSPFSSITGPLNQSIFRFELTDMDVAEEREHILEIARAQGLEILRLPLHLATEEGLDKTYKSHTLGKTIYPPGVNLAYTLFKDVQITPEKKGYTRSEIYNEQVRAYNEVFGPYSGNKPFITDNPVTRIVDQADTTGLAARLTNGTELQVKRSIAQMGLTAELPNRFNTGGATVSQRQALIDVAAELGIDPLDLATIIGFETAGTYNTDKTGGENDKFSGLIQFGEDERAAYGVTPGMTFEEQLRGPVLRYFKDRFKKAGIDTRGATFLQLYTTVLAGNPGANPDAADSFGTTARNAANPATEKGRIMAEHREAARIRFGF